MNAQEIRSLLYKSESATLDFKQELKIFGKGEGPKRERDELRRDILALANGDPRVAGENKYLVIGRADKPKADGTYTLFDASNQYYSADDLLKLVADIAYPRLNTIYSELVEVEGKQLLVITIPPTEYVHETTRPLRTPKREYTEHTVFMRRDESVVVASASDRAALRRAKQKYFDEREDVPPTKFGAGLGALLVASVARQQAKEKLGYGLIGQLYMMIIGSVIGALIGGLFGDGYKTYRYFLSEWPDLSPRGKTAVASVMAIVITLFSSLWNKLFELGLEERPNVRCDDHVVSQ